jgi:ABC-type phosphate transport system substrate-binding protein
MKKSIIKLVAMSFILLTTSLVHGEKIIFIAHEGNPVSSLTKSEIMKFYFKKVRQWPDGVPVRFFDRTDGSLERQTFLKEYLDRSARDIEEFWIGQKLFTGNSAPTQLATDKIMGIMIMRFPGAIGYVGKDFPLKEGIKKIEIIGKK